MIGQPGRVPIAERHQTYTSNLPEQEAIFWWAVNSFTGKATLPNISKAKRLTVSRYVLGFFEQRE